MPVPTRFIIHCCKDRQMTTLLTEVEMSPSNVEAHGNRKKLVLTWYCARRSSTVLQSGSGVRGGDGGPSGR